MACNKRENKKSRGTKRSPPKRARRNSRYNMGKRYILDKIVTPID